MAPLTALVTARDSASPLPIIAASGHFRSTRSTVLLGEQSRAELVHPRAQLFSPLGLDGLELLENRLDSVLLDKALRHTNDSASNEGGERLSLMSRDYLK
jgi:hypothetical protein